MNKKIFIIGGTLLFVIAIVIIICISDYQDNKNNIKKEPKSTINKTKNNKCVPITGGSFNLIFNTNGGNEIEGMHVCIACSPESYEDLPIPVKEGFDFDGWYYDNEFKTKVEATNSIDIKSVAEYDKNKCMIGYKDIELFANWLEVKKEQVEEHVVVTNNNNSNNSDNSNNNIPAQEDIPVNASTRLYKPTNSGTVISGFGFQYGNFHGMKIGTSYGTALFPINDGEFVAQGNRGYTYYNESYYIYKTTINNESYFVMYLIINARIEFAKTVDDYNNTNREVKYNEPIGRLLNNKYDVYITRVFSDNPSFIITGMTKAEYQINSNQLLNLNVGDSFEER